MGLTLALELALVRSLGPGRTLVIALVAVEMPRLPLQRLRVVPARQFACGRGLDEVEQQRWLPQRSPQRRVAGAASAATAASLIHSVLRLCQPEALGERRARRRRMRKGRDRAGAAELS